jgi:hypothetical protein
MHSSAALKQRVVAMLSGVGVGVGADIGGEAEDMLSVPSPSWVHRIRNGRYIMIRKSRKRQRPIEWPSRYSLPWGKSLSL